MGQLRTRSAVVAAPLLGVRNQDRPGSASIAEAMFSIRPSLPAASNVHRDSSRPWGWRAARLLEPGSSARGLAEAVSGSFRGGLSSWTSAPRDRAAASPAPPERRPLDRAGPGHAAQHWKAWFVASSDM